MNKKAHNALLLFALWGSSQAAHAQFATKAEPPIYTVSPAGTLLTGQDGWTNPVQGSGDFGAYTYSGNPFGLAVSPFTRANGAFFGGISTVNAPFARAQHRIELLSGTQWILSYDVAVKFMGNTPLPPTAASVSLHPETSAVFSILSLWDSPGNSTKYSTAVRGFSANSQPVVFKPNGVFSNLNAGQWYRVYVTFDFAKNIVLSIGILDFTTSTFDLRYPGLYLNGGAAGGNVLPDALRLFVGGNPSGTGAGNAAAWDNLDLRRTKESVITVSGQVSIDDLSNPVNRIVTLLFVPRDGTPRFHASAILNADGTFRTYITRKVDANVWLKADTALAKSIPVNTTNGDVGGITSTLINGDINNDNRVDINDLTALITVYNQRQGTGSYSEAADVNNDGSNDIFDLLILIRNYNQTGAAYP